MRPLEFLLGAVAGVFFTLWSIMLVDLVRDWRRRRRSAREFREDRDPWRNG